MLDAFLPIMLNYAAIIGTGLSVRLSSFNKTTLHYVDYLVSKIKRVTIYRYFCSQ